MSGALLAAGACVFWISWALMPGVGITDAARILELVAANRDRVLLSSVLQLASAGLFALALPGLARRFAPSRNKWGAAGVALVAMGACGDAADAIYHQVAYEMTGPGVGRAAMVAPFQRMQSVDLRYLAPLVAAFFLGSTALAIGAMRESIVPKWNPLLYAGAFAVAIVTGPRAQAFGATGRFVGLIVLALVSISLAWIGASLARNAATPPS